MYVTSLALVLLSLASTGGANAEGNTPALTSPPLSDEAPPTPPVTLATESGSAEDAHDVATPSPLYHPAGPKAGEWVLGLGATTDVLPTALVESEARVVPRVHAAFRYGLGHGFTLDSSLDAIVLTNEWRLGVSWSIDLGPLTLGLSDHLGFVFGHVPVSGFDTSVVGLSHYPGASLGFELGPHAVSLGFKALLAHLHNVRFGEAQVGKAKTIFHGVAFELMFESELGSGRLCYGATIFRASPDYQLWLVFSDSDLKLEFVRFKVAYAF